MQMKSLSVLIAIAALSGCASAPRGEIYNRPLAANPSAFVAADIGFARLVSEKGQIAAYRELAHAEAVLLNPNVRPAREALRGMTEPSVKMRWQPHSVVTSCDGNVGVTQGAWQQGAEQGLYTTLWQRDDKGRLQWRIDQRDAQSGVADAPEYIQTRQAVCRSKADREAEPVGTQAKDQSLSWSVTSATNGSGRLAVSLWDGKAMVPVISAASEQIIHD